MQRLIIFLGILCLCGCRRCTQGDDSSGKVAVPVTVDWEGSQWKEFGEAGRPSGMTLLAYYNEGKIKPVELKTNNVDKASLSLSKGMWNILVFNQSIDEYSSLRFSNMDDYSQARVETVPQETRWFTSSRADAQGTVSTTRQPIWIASGHYDMLNATGSGIVISPQAAIRRMKVKLRFANFASLYSVRCVLSGIAGDWIMSRDQAGTARTAHELTGWTVPPEGRAGGLGTVETVLQTFGLPGDYDYSADAMYLHLDIMLKDGKVLSFDNPVGDMVEHDPEEGVHILLDVGSGDEESGHNAPIELPEVQSTGGGLNASVDGWDQEIVNIKI